MMSTEHLIQKYYSAFNKMDLGTFFSLLDENVIHDINQGATEQGLKAFRRFMEVMDAHYREQVVELVVMVNGAGDRAAAEFVVEGTYIKTQKGLPEARGQKYRIPVGAFFEIRNNKISRVTNYYNLPDWIHQVDA